MSFNTSASATAIATATGRGTATTTATATHQAAHHWYNWSQDSTLTAVRWGKPCAGAVARSMRSSIVFRILSFCTVPWFHMAFCHLCSLLATSVAHGCQHRIASNYLLLMQGLSDCPRTSASMAPSLPWTLPKVVWVPVLVVRVTRGIDPKWLQLLCVECCFYLVPSIVPRTSPFRPP